MNVRKVIRPTESPPFFRTERVRDEAHRILEYLHLEEAERRQRRSNIDQDLFFSSQIIQPLEQLFLKKCAFCETKLDEGGSALHFRPLALTDSTQAKADHYLWLAFEWRNLFYACAFCMKSKGSAYPVKWSRAPFLATFDDVLAREAPLLLDPTRDDPVRHLRFLADGRCIGQSDRGEMTCVRGVLTWTRSTIASHGMAGHRHRGDLYASQMGRDRAS